MGRIFEPLTGVSDAAIGRRVQLRRTMLGLSVDEVARRYGVQDPTWRRWEYGERHFAAETLVRIAEILDCSLNYLVDCPGDSGLGAEEHYLLMLWRALPSEEESPWIKPSLLETLRRAAQAYMEERRSVSPGDAEVTQP